MQRICYLVINEQSTSTVRIKPKRLTLTLDLEIDNAYIVAVYNQILNSKHSEFNVNKNSFILTRIHSPTWSSSLKVRQKMYLISIGCSIIPECSSIIDPMHTKSCLWICTQTLGFWYIHLTVTNKFQWIDTSLNNLNAKR